MTVILDNLSGETKLGNRLRGMFASFQRMDVATGYFNLRGWALFTDLVEQKVVAGAQFPVARVLIGMVTGSAHQELVEAYRREVDGSSEEADREKAKERRAALVKILRDQLTRGIPTAGDRQALENLHRQVSSGAVEVKVFTDRPLHGKTYIFHRDDLSQPVTGFVGSSNLTHPGLMSNLELNTDVVDRQGAEDLAQWFEDRWNDTFSLQVRDELLAVIDDSWASPVARDPYEVYLKVCYDLSRDVREGLEEYSLSGRIKDELLDYQATAVKTLARRIMTRGGTMLGDVVGLGKTLTAIAVALMLRDEHGFQPLVVCPKNLVEMWEKHLEAYDLYGMVVPYSMSHTLADTRRFKFVIVDESHTLRNEKTKTYQHVQRYISENDSKALLLTATPFNIRYTDVANQLGLFIDEDEDLGLQPRMALSKRDFREKLEFGVSTLAAFRKSDEPEDWKRLMGEHLVRRTRSFIRKNYARKDVSGREYLTFADGTEFFFPRRQAIPIDHAFAQGDPAELMIADSTLDAIKNLKLPRYDLYSYVLPTALEQAGEDQRWIVADLEQSRGHVVGFVRTTFYKRLSSCGHSFILSLRRHLARNRLFLYALDNGLSFPVGTIDANVLVADGDGEDDVSSNVTSVNGVERDPAIDYRLLREKNPAGIRWLDSRLFVGKLRADLEEDNRVIAGLLESFGAWSVQRDSKVRALVDKVLTQHDGQKVLIFTEFKDSAEYLAAALRELGVARVGLATGDTEDPTAVARRFSPRSNTILVSGDELPSGEELDVLVATDVLSEGQNLQDSHVVVNYDIPWAIIQLIQRAGRVDRIGQTSDTVQIYTVSHGGVEDVLKLRKRVQERLAHNAATFGSDESFFDTEEEIRLLEDFYDGHLDEVEQEEEVDASSLAFEVWNRAMQEDPELAEKVANLPDLIDATRPARLGAKGIEGSGVVCHVQTESGMDAFAWANANAKETTPGQEGEPRMVLLTGHEALHTFEVSKGAHGRPRLEKHDDLVRLLVREGPLREQENIAGRLRGERKLLWNRLGNQLNLHGDALLGEALDALHERPLTVYATNRLRSARRKGASDDQLCEVIKSLYVRGELTIAATSGADPIRIVTVMGVNGD